MIKEFDDLKKIYLAEDVDSETYEENLAEITKWENQIIENENMTSWQEHEITKTILKRAKESYIEICLQLLNRTITDEYRKSLWAKQDACLWIIHLGSDDVETARKGIEAEIKMAIARV